MVAYPNSTLCRVSLHSDDTRVDLALPTGVPIAALMPAVVDIIVGHRGGEHTVEVAAPYRLSPPGAAPLDSSKTLAQHRIRDGSVLLLTHVAVQLPEPRFDDPAELVAVSVRATAHPWTPGATRLTSALAFGWLTGVGVLLLAHWSPATGAAAAAGGAGSALIVAMLARRVHGDAASGLAWALLSVGLAAVAGFVAVPGPPGVPNALLSATAAAAVAVLAVQLAGCDGPAMAATCCLSTVVAAAALAAALTGISPPALGTLSAGVSIGMLQAAARVSIKLVGLSRPSRPTTGADAVRARNLLTGLVVGFSLTTVLGVGGVVAGAHTGRASCLGAVTFAGAIGVVLLLQTRSHTEQSQIAALIAAGIGSFTLALIVAAYTAPQHRVWLSAAAAGLAVATLRLGFTASAPSPLTRRGIDWLEYLALAALVPLAGWVCNWFGVVRGLSLI